MEPLIVIVGFLGAGKTTLLKKLVSNCLESNMDPFVILNDYENASVDSQLFLNLLSNDQIEALSGSCICCSGINELRQSVNNTPTRTNGITLIEANGTTDACSLMEFLGVGVKKQLSPPIQISVVEVEQWQKRGPHNELEANQIQVSSLVVLNRYQESDNRRIEEVKANIHQLNPYAKIINWDNLDIEIINDLKSINYQTEKMDHLKSHWSSYSIDLPDPMESKQLDQLLNSLPKSLLRVKGCTRLDDLDQYIYFEKSPSGKITKREFKSRLISGPKLLVVGPGSDPNKIKKLLQETL